MTTAVATIRRPRRRGESRRGARGGPPVRRSPDAQRASPYCRTCRRRDWDLLPSSTSAPEGPAGGGRGQMKAAYRGFAFAVAIGVVLQAAWIALGTFQIAHETDDGKIIDKNYDGNFGLNMHGLFAILVLVCALILMGLAFGAHVPEGKKWAGFVLLAVV